MIKMTGFKQFFINETEKIKHIEKINGIIKINGLILFFTFEDNVYGTPEEGRIVFAMMKDKRKNPDGLEGSFIGYDLKQALDNKEVTKNFSKKDLKHIKVIDQNKVVELLSKENKGPYFLRAK